MNVDLIAAIGIVGSVASIAGLLLPATGWRVKLLHVAYGLAVGALAIGIVHYQTQLSQLKRIEVQAQKLVRSHQREDGSWGGGGNPFVSDRGFMLAGLSFLEKYKDRFPETYARAKVFCENAGVLQPASHGSFSEQSDRAKNLDEGSRAIRALLEGIASGAMD
jgi:hypothetical protein